MPAGMSGAPPAPRFRAPLPGDDPSAENATANATADTTTPAATADITARLRPPAALPAVAASGVCEACTGMGAPRLALPRLLFGMAIDNKRQG